MDLVGPITELLKCLMPPVCRHLEYQIRLQKKMEELRRLLEDLNNRRYDINLKKQSADARPRKVVSAQVMSWLEKVETINNEIPEVEQKFQNISCLYPGSLGKCVYKKIEEVRELILQHGNLPDDIAIDQPPSRGIKLLTEDLRGQTNVKEQIWGYLMGDAVEMIGVCGPGGMGKTTLMKNIHNDLLNESKFAKVIWVTVLYPVNIFKLQENIASNMQQTLPENLNEERASTLFGILSSVRYALILDDAWGSFSFENVGIPKPTQQNGCKIVITSRSVELCNYIGCKQIIRMQQLSKEESLNLFLDTVGRVVLVKIPNLGKTLKSVVAECAGLPLAIVVIARSMRGENDILAWNNALFELRSCVKSVKDWDDEIFKRLKFSYDRLNDLELRNCFLFCSLYPKDESIRRYNLIQGWIDNGLIKHSEQLKTRKAMHDRANVILNSLINKCLIERVEYDSDYCIKMHDVMRDMALRVAGPRFMAKARLLLTEEPGMNEWTENHEKVSLCNNVITDIACNMSPNCPKLSSLDFSWIYVLRQIPDSFFVHMIGLKFLNLSGTNIDSLPDSISNLENLTVFLLHCCLNLRYVLSLAKLKALKKLDLKETGIEKAPQGMEMLVNLQYLNLDCPKQVVLPMEVLCNLTDLQFLVVVLKPTSFAMKAEKLIRLNMLETFIGQFDDLQGLNNFLRSFNQDQKFTRYWIRVGVTDATVKVFELCMSLDDFEIGRDYNKLLSGMECSKIIFLSGVEIRRDYSLLFLKDFQFLKIRNCSTVKSLSEISLFKMVTDFRYCEIDGCTGLECMLDLFSSSSLCSSFDKLETLELKKLPDLQVLVKVEAQVASVSSMSWQPTSSSIFYSLKIFKISFCQRINKLFPSELLKGLKNTEEIDVFHCPKLEEVIEVEEEKEALRLVGNNKTITIALPKLRKFRLVGLPKLKSICTARGVIGSNFLQTLEIYRCPMLNRIPLYLPLLPNGELSVPPLLQEICIDSRIWWESLVWDNPSTKDIFLPFLKPYNDAPFLEKGFHDLQDFNNFVKSLEDQKLTWYQLCVEATDDDDDGGNNGNYDDSDCNFDYDSDYDFDDDCSKMVTLSGIEINGDYSRLLPDDLQLLRITKCCGMKSLNEAFAFKALSDLRSCQIKQCDKLECMLELFSSSSVYSPFDRLSILKLIKLPNLCVLVKVERQAASAPYTSCAPTQPSIFSNLKFLLISDCPRIKKLFPSELLKCLQNLEKIYVIGCVTMEEIIEVEEEKETLMIDREKETITFVLPNLKGMGLMDLPNLKSICTTRGVMVCDSLQCIGIGECPKLKTIPLYLPVLPNGQLSPSPSLKEICIESREREWWEPLVWDNRPTKDILLPFL